MEDITVNSSVLFIMKNATNRGLDKKTTIQTIIPNSIVSIYLMDM